MTSIPSVVPHGKFFLRGTQKFFLKAVRLEGPIIVSDFDRKLRVLARLEELRRDHATALVLSEEQAEATLELAALGGLYVLVELAVDPAQLWTRRGLRGTEAWIEAAVRSLGGRAGLLGFIIDCPLGQDELRAHGLKPAREALRRLVRVVRAAGFAAGIHHRIGTRALALEDEDFIYSDATGLSPAELRDYLAAMHNVADARPVIIEFRASGAGGDELVSTAFGMGAAGVVAPDFAAPTPLNAPGPVPIEPPTPRLPLAMNGDRQPAPDGFIARATVAMLAYTGPMARTFARYRARFAIAAAMGVGTPPRQRPQLDLRRRAVMLTHWNERYTTRETILAKLTRLFNRLRYPVSIASGWRDYDLEVRPDLWTRIEIRTADEEHGGTRLLNRVAARVRLSVAAWAAMLAGIASTAACAMLGKPAAVIVATALTAAGILCLLAELFEARRLAYRAVEACAREADLTPLGAPVRPLRGLSRPGAEARHTQAPRLLAD